ncbi:hypothetical protein K1719_027813 [Acacia pycnantha]|nr:hypothetical protein K1719_027813 [Acacia pycnantha]
MQAQLASNITFQQARGKEQTRRLARGEQGSNCSLSHHHNSVYRRIGKDNGIHPAESNFTEYSTGHEESVKGTFSGSAKVPYFLFILDGKAKQMVNGVKQSPKAQRQYAYEAKTTLQVRKTS